MKKSALTNPLGLRFLKRLPLPITAGMIAVVFLWRSSALWMIPSYLSPENVYTLPQIPVTPSPPPKVTPISSHKPSLTAHAQNFNPALAAGKRLIAFIVSGIGEDASLTQRALEALPKEVTIAISPHTKDAQYWAQEFHQKGHEILASIDLEPEDYPLNDPGPQTILTKLSPEMMESRLTESLEKVPYALGVTHESGNLFVTKENPLNTWLNVLNKKGLGILDMVLSPQTLIPQLALKNEQPFLVVDFSLSLERLSREKSGSLIPEALREDMLVVSVPLSPKAMLLMAQTPSEAKPSPAGRGKMTPGTALIPFSFALSRRS